MAYRSDLYTVSNIIGYTGQLHRLPTVYFQCDTAHIRGRITQQHRYSFNMGRGEPASVVGHVMRNEIVNGRNVLREYVNGTLKHTSRNPLIRIGQTGAHLNRGGLDVATLAILAQSIRRCPDAKDTAGLSADDVYDVHIAIAQKTNMLAELSEHIALVGDMRPSKVSEYADYNCEVDMNNAVLRSHFAAMANRGQRGRGRI